MLNRWLGIALAAGMLLVNAELIRRDVLAHWLSGDPPPNRALRLAPGEMLETQVGIYDRDGRPIGKSWTKASKTPAENADNLVRVDTTTLLRPILLPGGLQTPPVRIETNVIYRHGETSVDSLDFRMFGLGIPVSLRAEAVGADDFPFTWQVGEQSGKVSLDSRVPKLLGTVIRPFDDMPNLYVGRRWRIDVLDVASQLLPQVGAAGLDLEPIVIEVTGKEEIEHNGRRIETFVVEGGGARAWVAPDGRVLKQTVRLPLLGELVLLDEPFQEKARFAARDEIPDIWPASHDDDQAPRRRPAADREPTSRAAAAEEPQRWDPRRP